MVYFYDLFEEANLWGKNLYDYLSDVYRNKAFYTIMFVSKDYNQKLWTNHERQAMQSRAFQENQEYILPVRFDSTEIPGLLPTIGYISLASKTPAEFADIICKKLILSGRTIPSENIRRSLSPLVKVPKSSLSEFTISLKISANEPLSGGTILLVADNNTYLKALSNKDGQAVFKINTRRNYKLYFAHENYPAYMVKNIDPQYNIDLLVHGSEKCWLCDF